MTTGGAREGAARDAARGSREQKSEVTLLDTSTGQDPRQQEEFTREPSTSTDIDPGVTCRGDRDEESEGVTFEVASLELQTHALEDLLKMHSFQAAAPEALISKMRDLRATALHACGHFVAPVDTPAYQAESVMKWARVLQRTLDAAVRETFQDINEDVVSGIGVIDDEGRAVLGVSTIWKALSFQCRLELIPPPPEQLSDEDK